MEEDTNLEVLGGESSLDVQYTPTNNLTFSNKTNEAIYTLIRAIGSQKELQHWEDRPDISETSKKMLMRFGIIIGNPEVVDLSDRSYLLTVEADWLDDLENHCINYVANFLPEDAVPTHYAINKFISSYDELRVWDTRLKEIYPRIQSLVDYTHLTESNARQNRLDTLIQAAESVGLKPFFLDKYMGDLLEEFKTSNRRTLDKFKELEDAVLDFRKDNPNLVLMCEGPVPDHTSAVCAYLFYKYRIPNNLPAGTHTGLYLDKVSDLLFNKNRMLVEEQLAYLKDLPRVGVSFAAQQRLSFLVLIEKYNMECKVLIRYMDIEAPSTLIKAELNLSEIAIIPWKYEYRIDTTDVSTFRAEHDKIMKLFITFESLDSKTAKTLDMTNTCLLQIDGEKKLAVVEDISLKLPCVYTPIHNSLGKFSKVLGLSDISRVLPIDVLPGYKEHLAKPLSSIITAFEKSTPGKGLAIQKEIAKFYKHDHAYGTILSEFGNAGHRLLGFSGVDDFVTIGLWWNETYRYRVALGKLLSPYLDIKASRKYTGFFSIFGGPLPMFGDLLDIREEVLKEG